MVGIIAFYSDLFFLKLRLISLICLIGLMLIGFNSSVYPISPDRNLVKNMLFKEEGVKMHKLDLIYQ